MYCGGEQPHRFLCLKMSRWRVEYIFHPILIDHTKFPYHKKDLLKQVIWWIQYANMDSTLSIGLFLNECFSWTSCGFAARPLDWAAAHGIKDDFVLLSVYRWVRIKYVTVTSLCDNRKRVDVVHARMGRTILWFWCVMLYERYTQILSTQTS